MKIGFEMSKSCDSVNLKIFSIINDSFPSLQRPIIIEQFTFQDIEEFYNVSFHICYYGETSDVKCGQSKILRSRT
jgi:hypothetical protein